LPSSADCASAAPSYEGEIAPLLAGRCSFCHSPPGIASRVVFDTYDQALHWYKLMYTQVFSCLMPPSCAGALPDAERQMLLKWFVCKAPPGPFEPRDAGADPPEAGRDPMGGADGLDAAGLAPADGGEP